MKVLEFAMVATAVAGPVVHADGMGAGRPRLHRTLASGPAPKSRASTNRPGFYESITQPAVIAG